MLDFGIAEKQENDPPYLLNEPYKISHLISQYAFGPNDFVENVLTDMCIHSRQGIIKQIHVTFPVNSTCQAHPLFLSSR